MTPECRRVDEHLLDLVYEELEAGERERIRAHVAGCGRCAGEVESLARTRVALRALPDEDPPSAITTRLMHEAAAPRTWAQKIAALFVLHPAWSLGAAAAAVLLVSLTLFQRSKGIEEVARQREIERTDLPAVGPVHEPVAPEPAPAPAPEPDEDDGLAAFPAEATPGKAARGDRARIRPKKPTYSQLPPPSSAPADRSSEPRRAVREKAVQPDLLQGAKSDPLFDGAAGGTGFGAEGALERRAAARAPAMPAAQEAPATPEVPDPAETIHKEGDRFRRKGDCGSAVKLYERVIRDFPRYSRLAEVRRSLSTCRQAMRAEGDTSPGAAESAPAAKPAD